jgi:phospholipid/cholesterol/gamma-HCH transport system ATP-binding protein
MAETTKPILEIRQLMGGYPGHVVLDDISFDVRTGEVFVIMGPSGCGKTTLLRTLTGLIDPLDGEVLYRGKRVEGRSALDAYRRSFGMVFQQGALLNSVSLMENVALPLKEHTDLPGWMIRQVVRMKLAQVGLLDARHRLPMELSGGMRKRAGIARALALEPSLLYFDEPSGGLDPITADGIDSLILSLKKTLPVTIVVVSHELASIFKIADRVMMLRDGGIAVLSSRDGVRESGDEVVQQFIHRRAPAEEGAADQFLTDVGGGGV